MLCKQHIRRNERQLDAFIRSQIDTKVFDLCYKCDGFTRPIDQNAEWFKGFKRVMDKRNNAIHGNCNPEREQIERVYFERTRPLFAEAGDHIGKFLEALERQHEPKTIIKDYEIVHSFFIEVAACLEPGLVEDFWRIMDDHYPGYDFDRKKLGCLFPEQLVVAGVPGMKYDDELPVVWT